MSQKSDSSSEDSTQSTRYEEKDERKDESCLVQNKMTVLIGFIILLLLAFIAGGLVILFELPGLIDYSEEDNEPIAERLSANIRPDHYLLALTVYLSGYGPRMKSSEFLKKANDFIFEGNVKIDIHVLEPTDTVKLHFLDLNLTRIRLTGKNNVEVPLASHEEDRVSQLLVLNFNQTLKAGIYVLEIDYVGRLRDDLSGLYKAVYQGNGEMKTMAVTQFEPSSARKMVPCFDEPRAKAKWTVIVTHPVGTVALSNMMEIKTTPVNQELQTTSFKTSPRMSTYLLAVCIADFEQRVGRSKSGVLFRVWARPYDFPNTEFALKTGIRINDEYEDYFGVKFPLEKQDMVAVPEFAAGAMENWGLITYKESALLTGYYGNDGVVAAVIAHELAHQWFGNLVTMEWWNDLWLNEGFARYFEYFAEENKNNRREYFYFDEDYCLSHDSHSFAHPLSRKVDTVYDAESSFYSMTYNKGAILITMLRNIMGEKKFQAGLRSYLKKHSYGNVEHSDLFNAMDEQSSIRPDGQKFDVRKFGRMWTTQVGYPLLTVTRTSPTSVKISQERFRNDPDMQDNPNYGKPKDGFKWDVPIWYRVGTKSKQTKFTFLPAENPILVNTSDLTILNADGKGYYRVNYDVDTWREIINTLKANPSAYSGGAVQRLVSDIFLIAASGKVDYQTVIDLIESVDLKNALIGYSVREGLNSVLAYYGNEPERRSIELYFKKLYERTSHGHKRRNVNFWEQRFDEKMEPEDVAELKLRRKRFQLSDRYFEFSERIIKGGEPEFNRILELAYIEQIPSKKVELVKAMASARDPALLKRILPIIINKRSPILRKDVAEVYERMCSNVVYQEMMVSELLHRWTEIYEYMKTRGKDLNKIIGYSVARINDSITLGTMKEFMNEHPETFKFESFALAIENAEIRLKWKEKFYKQVADLFAKAYKKLL